MTLHYATVKDLLNFRVGCEALEFGCCTEEDLESNLAIAESIVESYVNTLFYEITQSIYFNGNGNQNLYVYQLLNYPIISVSSCTEVNEFDAVLWAYEEGRDFVVTPWYISKNWNRLSARLTSGSTGPTWAKGCRNIKVTGVWGHADVPIEVKRATLLLGAEITKAGSSGLRDTNILKQRWDDYEVQLRNQKPIEPSDTTGFDFIDKLLDKWRFKPDMFLTPEVHIPVFSGNNYVY